MLGFLIKIGSSAKNYFVVPLIIGSSIIVEFSKKYLSNTAAFQDITETENPHDTLVQNLAIGFAATATLMQLTIIGRIVWNEMTSDKSQNEQSDVASLDAPTEDKFEEKTHRDTSFQRSDEASQTEMVQIPLDVFTTDEAGEEIVFTRMANPISSEPAQESGLTQAEETACEDCSKDYCDCSKRCVSSYLSSMFKVSGIIKVVPVILGGKLGLTMLFSAAMKLSEEEFLQNDSTSAEILRAMTWGLPLAACIQFTIFTLVKGANKNADAVKQSIQANQYDVKGKMLVSSIGLALPCIIGSSFLDYYFSKKVIPQIGFLKNLLKTDSAIEGVSLFFGAVNFPALGIALIPTAYRLLHNFSQADSQTFSFLLAINLMSVISNSACDLLGMRIGMQCALRDNDIGFIDDHRHLNSSSIVFCPTTQGVEGIAYLVGISGSLAFTLFNLAGLKSLQNQKKQLTSPGRNSIFAHPKTRDLAVPLLAEKNPSPAYPSLQ